MKGTQSPIAQPGEQSRVTTAAYPKSASSGKVPPPTPRNMTGIYLGLDNGELPRRLATASPPSGGSAKLVPPLARGRGIPMRVRTPTEQRRYKMVENLRSQKEETLKSIEERRTGLLGNPLKPHQKKNKFQSPHVVDELAPRLLGSVPSQTDIQELTRKNPREYSFVNNQGVTHPEYLRSDNDVNELVDKSKSSDVFGVSLQETVAQEVDRVSKTRNLIGLEECYKKICKGNVGSLYSLLPQRKLQQAKKDGQQRNTGLTIKSYRNPKQAEIMAHFPSDDSRPSTTAGRAFVPQPYFYKMYVNQSQRVNSSPARLKKNAFEEQFSSLQGSSKILAIPGAGLVSQSLSRVRCSNSPRDLATPEGPDNLADCVKKDMYIDLGHPSKGKENRNAVSVPQPIVADDNQSEITTVTDNGVEELRADVLTENKEQANMNKVKADDNANNNGNMAETMETVENGEKDNDHINLVLENEEGSQGVLDIDEADEVIATSPREDPEKEKPVLQRRTSIKERLMKMKSSESLVESIKSECETRKKDFEHLIEEHNQIIEEITTMKESATIETELNDLVNGGSQTT